MPFHKHKIVTAIYVDSAEVFQKFIPKHSELFGHHSSIAYDPENLNDIEVGKPYTLSIIGRAYDEKGDALLVENKKSTLRYPHITLSCAPGIGPIYSNELLEQAMKEKTVEYFVEPISIEGVEGYYDDGIVHT